MSFSNLNHAEAKKIQPNFVLLLNLYITVGESLLHVPLKTVPPCPNAPLNVYDDLYKHP